jgi:hypothetical protein
VTKLLKAREAAGSGISPFLLSHPLSAASRALQFLWFDDPGVSLRFTPGSTPSPATAGWVNLLNHELNYTMGSLSGAA